MTGLLFALALAAAAVPSTNHVLSWDYPLAFQPGTAYSLKLVTLRDGQPVQWEQPLPVLAHEACPAEGHPTATTLCSTLCLDAGEYTLTVRAHRGGVDSPPSPLLDADLSQEVGCRGAGSPPPAPKPPSPTANVAPVVAGVAVGGAIAAIAATQSHVPGIFGMINMSCVNWHLEGPCFCSPFHPCVSVSYMQPSYIVEVVKKPGDTVVPILGHVLQAALTAAGSGLIGGGGASNSNGSGQTNLHYSEVHVYTFPDLWGSPCSGCAPTGGIGLNYSSEIDAASWRTGVATPSPLDLLLSVGVWGHLYPRSGKVIHGSEVIAAALAAVRGMDIAHQPIGTPPNVDAHIVPMPTTMRASCMQMAYPKQLPCMDPGGPPPLWETGTTSITGKYVFIIFERKRCCVNPAQATCGITLPGIGGHGQALCLLPPLP